MPSASGSMPTPLASCTNVTASVAAERSPAMFRMNERSILSVLAGSSSTATVASQAVDEERGASAAAVHYPARHA
jgi:hypothetical protein